MEDSERSTMTRWVAIVLLILFSFSLVYLIIFNTVLYFPKSEVNERWFAIMKDGLVLLGTSLTTIIGYYFGQRRAEQAENKAKEAEKNLEAADKIVQNQSEQIRELGNIAPNATSNDPVDIDLSKTRVK